MISPEVGGPMAASLSQLFYAVRTLSDAGIVDPHTVGVQLRAKPPLDTPVCLISYECNLRPAGHWDSFPREQEPIARSIRDLLSEFDFVMPLTDPDEIE